MPLEPGHHVDEAVTYGDIAPLGPASEEPLDPPEWILRQIHPDHIELISHRRDGAEERGKLLWIDAAATRVIL